MNLSVVMSALPTYLQELFEVLQLEARRRVLVKVVEAGSGDEGHREADDAGAADLFEDEALQRHEVGMRGQTCMNVDLLPSFEPGLHGVEVLENGLLPSSHALVPDGVDVGAQAVELGNLGS